MSTTIWFREDEETQWRPASPAWTAIPEQQAHQIADHYNTKYNHGMWWVSHKKPSKDQVVEGWKKSTLHSQ